MNEEMKNEIEEKKEYLKGYERAIRQIKRSELKINEMRLNRICPSVNTVSTIFYIVCLILRYKFNVMLKCYKKAQSLKKC